jgi:hypothetical protein
MIASPAADDCKPLQVELLPSIVTLDRAPHPGRQAGKRRGDTALREHRHVPGWQLHGVNPEAYFTDVLTKLVNNWPNSRLAELLPWAWAAETR